MLSFTSHYKGFETLTQGQWEVTEELFSRRGIRLRTALQLRSWVCTDHSNSTFLITWHQAEWLPCDSVREKHAWATFRTEVLAPGLSCLWMSLDPDVMPQTDAAISQPWGERASKYSWGWWTSWELQSHDGGKHCMGRKRRNTRKDDSFEERSGRAKITGGEGRGENQSSGCVVSAVRACVCVCVRACTCVHACACVCPHLSALKRERALSPLSTYTHSCDLLYAQHCTYQGL